MKGSDPGKTVLVTGAGSGIGKATAIECARRGWHVCATVHHQSSVSEFSSICGNITVEVLDVCDELQRKTVIEKYRPDAIVNNAGVGAAGAIEDVDLANARRAIDVMAVAPIALAKLGLVHMRAKGHGRIVNVSSLGGRTSAPLVGWYAASKHALESLSDSLRMEVAGSGIAVIVVEPGGANTGILEKSVDHAMGQPETRFVESYKRAERLTRLTHRFNGSPERVAKVIADALESPKPKSRYVVGIDARLLLMGGSVMPRRLKDPLKRKLLKL